MKHLTQTAVLVLALSATAIVNVQAGPLDGVVLGSTKFVDNGPDAERFNFVLLAEGYQQSELGKFASDAQAFVNYFFNTPPFSTNRTCFNFWRVDVASTQSGADDPSGCADGTTGSGTIGGHLLRCHLLFLRSEASADSGRLAGYDRAWGPSAKLGCGVGHWSIRPATAGRAAPLALPHWPAHGSRSPFTSLATRGLAWGTNTGIGPGARLTRPAHAIIIPAPNRSTPNVTIQTTNDLVKWCDLFYPGIAIPTTVNANCAQCDSQPDPYPGQARVGLYEGADYYHCGVYRPAFRCMMRDYAPYCPVCAARIAQVLQPYQPGNNPPLVFNPSFHGNAFTLSVPSSIGKTYQLEFKNSLADLTWTPLPEVPGTGQMLVLTDATATNAHRFYHVRQW